MVIDKVFGTDEIIFPPMTVILFQLVFISERSTFQNSAFAVNADFPAMAGVDNAARLVRVTPT